MKIKMKNTKIEKLKISYLTVQWLTLTFSELNREIQFINKQRRHTNFFPKKFLFFHLKDFIFISISVICINFVEYKGFKKSVTDRQTYIQTKRFIE